MAERLIDANALIDWLTRATGFRTNCDDCTDIDCLNCIIEEAIKNAPTVEAKPVVHARWEIEKYQAPFDDELQYKMTCSKCGYDYCSDEVYCLEYCARCGAQMDESISCSHEDDMM